MDLNVIPFDLVDVRGRALDPAAVALPAEVLTVVDANLARAISDHVINLAADGTMSGPQALTARAAAETMFSGWLQRLSLDSVALDSAKSSWDGVIAYIDTHLHSLPSVAELAARWGYSRNHFSREFRRRVGLSPQQYVVRARFAVAEALLTETTLGVGKIAGRLGYASVYVFSQAFARHTGLSPTAWRRRVLAGRQPNVVNSSRESDPDLSRGRGAGFSP